MTQLLSNRSNLYTIDLMTGSRTAVGGRLPITGGVKSIDFNPTVDLVRVSGSSGTVRHLRVNPDTGAVVGTDGNSLLGGGPVGSSLYTVNLGTGC